jgi:hypothetical protein
MGLALDEPSANDENIEAEGFPFIAAGEVSQLIRASGGLSIDYADGWLKKGFQVSLVGQGAC